MASSYPAEAVGQSQRLGGLTKGMRANIVALTENLEVASVWIDGVREFRA
ncbi:amidohydrolase family protein [Aquamicrobium sp.]|nr:amidohydrolase family protein [Aquamicrobium sp.]MCK9552803.1 amidohydrolase family protein [Aquamicrobium sp.]